MSLASLAMYVSPAPIAEATRLFWEVLGKRIRGYGLDALRGARAAINEPGSNSGYNLFRAFVAPHAVDGRFFSSVKETGGHRASIDAVSSGEADVAAIDCVTFGNTLRFDPDRVAGVRILAETPRGPGLPFITGAATPARDLIILRRALSETIADPELAAVCDTLSLRGISLLGDADYEVLAELDREAADQGYPTIA
ncbi:ABC-type phosphate/phosphonate transport system substrate-binding protein [Pararhizobium capsulatum DSM 1112]|uniref:ABC-type phosphate/phosphonate transport system substrate-binding protein n=1 Tax=Pararhizobium capsulatum DSM 1112 TaxID=1121113 RepID=A0ABU0BW97_9HYPH|nr:PhnD/SsuA/transferrin family substrate-binding protein [Pararhizobium capsulatum]MDQ0321725.1 ABC-type phosphate/phosphonate transport system substrate-binding protein [Pararhizobium capsulatum DSM 1112]